MQSKRLAVFIAWFGFFINPVFADDSFSTYKNQKYGFDIQYPASWIVREITEEGRDKIISFESPTTDQEWLNLHTHIDNTASVFQVEIYTKQQYQQAQENCRNAQKEGYEPSYCLRKDNIYGQNKGYIFVVYSPRSAGYSGPADFIYEEHTLKTDQSLKTFMPYSEK